MKCSHCNKRLGLSHRPGVFFSIAVLFAIAAPAAWTFLAAPYNVVFGGALGLIALISLGGVFTAMTDASAWVYSRFKRKGVECDSCHHINSIRPWSL